MNIPRILSQINRPNVVQKFYRKYRLSSCNYESTQATNTLIQEEKFDFEDVKVIERTERRKAAIPPFMKDAFISIFNKELLAYPEILNKDENDEMDGRIKTLETTFKNSESSRNDKRNALKRTNLFGAPFNLTNNGLALNITERIRYLETVSTDLDLAKRLSDHWVALQALKLGFTPNELAKLIPHLSSGEKLVCLCTKETLSTRVTQSDFRTTAQMDGQGVWRINGEKICHYGDGYFLVLSTVEAARIKGFLVHPNAEGVSFVEPYVAFRNTPGIPLEEISEKALGDTLGLSRIDTTVLCYSLLRETIMKIIEFVRGKYVSGKPLADVATIRSKVGNALQTLYAAESMVYFTAGLMDGYHDPDADVEMAMCRSFITTHGLEAILSLLTIPGLEAIDNTWTSYLDQFRRLSVQDEIIDNIDMFIALTALHYAGQALADDVKQIRNPLFHPTFILAKIFKDRHQEADNPKLTLRLSEHLHPSLKMPSEALEYAVLRLRFTCETVLSRHGLDVGKALTELVRLSQAGCEVLAMASVLGRASRSYCIGVRNSEIEMKMAATFVENSKYRFKKLILDLNDGEYLNLDHFRIEFGKKVLDTGTVLVEKPIERVFW